MRIDLHTHSARSDGTETPAQLMAAAARAELDVVALTDHDTFAGWSEAEAAVPDTGVALVRGVEISCSAKGISVHLLAYLPDPTYAPLHRLLAAGRENRDARARIMVERLAVDFDLQWDDVAAQVAEGATVGRPHIADALVARGHVADRSAAFEVLLHPRGPYYVHHAAPDPIDAVRIVREAGGVPVFAHPGAWSRGKVVGPETIEAMAAAGLAGLETEHRDHDEPTRESLRALAGSLGLFTTGSSDYHGTGKPNVLGENLTSAEVLAQIEAEGRIAIVRP